jgi:hypothetical protein
MAGKYRIDPDYSGDVMNLLDGLNCYKSDPVYWQFTQDVERSAQRVLELILRYRAEPTLMVLDAAHALLISIEKWKAMCLEERMVNAEQNSSRDVWEAFRGAINAQSDLEAILSVMQLRGFGASRDVQTGQRRAKVATAVLRFLNPGEWGVVDWRTAAILAQLDKSNGDITQAIVKAQAEKKADLKELFDIIDEKAACEYNRRYRAMRAGPPFSRTADVEMALFGLSLLAWPMRKAT